MTIQVLRPNHTNIDVQDPIAGPHILQCNGQSRNILDNQVVVPSLMGT